MECLIRMLTIIELDQKLSSMANQPEEHTSKGSPKSPGEAQVCCVHTYRRLTLYDV